MRRMKLDSDDFGVAEYYIGAAICALVGDSAGAEANTETQEIIVTGIDPESDQFKLIVKTFREMRVKGAGPNSVDLPVPKRSTGDLEEIRLAVEQAIFDNINTFENDGVSITVVKSKKGEYLRILVTGDNAPRVTRRDISVINYLFKAGKVHA